MALVEYYLPGYRAGGALRSAANMAEHLKGDLEFNILSRDRDLGDQVPYHAVHYGDWRSLGAARVQYIAPFPRAISAVFKVLRSSNYDVLYLNSFFSPLFSIYPLMLRRGGLLPAAPVVLAPRGELSPSALRFRWPKKRAYIGLARAAHLVENVTWHASSELESEQIRAQFPMASRICIAGDLCARRPARSPPTAERIKTSGSIRIAFLSRISPIKNLDGALSMLEGVKGNVTFDIFGPVEDRGYWERCHDQMRRLSSSTSVRLRGPLSPDDVQGTLQQYHLFFLPSRGESFGHVIVEALLAGCPVLLSDRTPWRSLQERGVGWDIPLECEGEFRRVLCDCVNMDHAAFSDMSAKAALLGASLVDCQESREKTCDLFRSAAAGAYPDC